MIQVDSLSVQYGRATALRNVSVRIRQGEIFAIVGPSGCGKSTFLSTLNRMTDLIPHAKVSGEIRVEGTDIYAKNVSPSELRKRVGMIFQKPNPLPGSIARNIQLALKEHGIRNRSERQQITEQVLRDVGLWDEVKDRLNQPALHLSGGQQQRLCIARAIALQPQVVLMDEPCSALDPIASSTVENLIERLRGQFTIVIVTHNLAQARRISDRVGVFWVNDGHGELIAEGPTAELFENCENEIAQAYLAGASG